MISNSQDAANDSLYSPRSWPYGKQDIIYSGDIRHPWKSVFGFSLTTAKLAAHQKLALHCREDEIFELMAKLNNLIERPRVINRTYTWLKLLEQQHYHKLAGLIELKEKPVTEAETAQLLETVDEILSENTNEATADRLREVLAPNHSVEEIAGLRKMLAKLQLLIPAVEQVKERGFRAVVFDRRRQPLRPAWEVHRHKSILQNGQQTDFTAGLFLPRRHHLTLWNYLIIRSEGQSTIWN